MKHYMSEFENDNDYQSIFENHKFFSGRMIWGSKSSYCNQYPNHEVYFNANIIIIPDGKIWYGDIDVTIDEKELQKIANEIEKDLYILREMDGRFENQDKDFTELITKAVKVIEFKK